MVLAGGGTYMEFLNGRKLTKKKKNARRSKGVPKNNAQTEEVAARVYFKRRTAIYYGNDIIQRTNPRDGSICW